MKKNKLPAGSLTPKNESEMPAVGWGASKHLTIYYKAMRSGMEYRKKNPISSSSSLDTKRRWVFSTMSIMGSSGNTKWMDIPGTCKVVPKGTPDWELHLSKGFICVWKWYWHHQPIVARRIWHVEIKVDTDQLCPWTRSPWLQFWIRSYSRLRSRGWYRLCIFLRSPISTFR